MNPTDKRIFAIASAFHRDYSVDKIWQMTNIDKWFLSKLLNIHNMEMHLRYHGYSSSLLRYSNSLGSDSSISSITSETLFQAKQLGFSDRLVASCIGSTELAVRRLRQEASIFPFVKQIDTVAAEFPALTNYLYTTYNGAEHDVSFEDRGVMVLGSGDRKSVV